MLLHTNFDSYAIHMTLISKNTTKMRWSGAGKSHNIQYNKQCERNESIPPICSEISNFGCTQAKSAAFLSRNLTLAEIGEIFVHKTDISTKSSFVINVCFVEIPFQWILTIGWSVLIDCATRVLYEWNNVPFAHIFKYIFLLSTNGCISCCFMASNVALLLSLYQRWVCFKLVIATVLYATWWISTHSTRTINHRSLYSIELFACLFVFCLLLVDYAIIFSVYRAQAKAWNESLDDSMKISGYSHTLNLIN